MFILRTFIKLAIGYIILSPLITNAQVNTENDCAKLLDIPGVHLSTWFRERTSMPQAAKGGCNPNPRWECIAHRSICCNECCAAWKKATESDYVERHLAYDRCVFANRKKLEVEQNKKKDLQKRKNEQELEKDRTSISEGHKPLITDTKNAGNNQTSPIRTIRFTTNYYSRLGIYFKVLESSARKSNGQVHEGILAEDIKIPQHCQGNLSHYFFAKKGTLISFSTMRDAGVGDWSIGRIAKCTLRDAARLTIAQFESVGPDVWLPADTKVEFTIGVIDVDTEVGTTITSMILGDGCTIRGKYYPRGTTVNYNNLTN